MVTQREPLHPTILNVLADAVVLHWVSLVAGGAEGQDEWGREVLHHVALLYIDNSLVASIEPDCMQGTFDNLARLFDMVGIHTNVGETVGMLCRPCRAVGTH